MKCGCHPNCGTGTALLVSKRTKEWAPLADVFNVERFFDDARHIADSARSPLVTKIQTALSVLRNYRPSRAPEGFKLVDLIKKRAGQPITKKDRPAGGNVVDLMEALRRSVGDAQPAKASKPSKKPRKAASGRKEMLVPITGKR